MTEGMYESRKRLALLGASGHGKVVADIAHCAGWQSVQFFDDAWPSLQAIGHWPVVGDTYKLLERIRDFDGVLVTIGQCATRWQKQRILLSSQAPLVTLVHPQAIVSCYAKLGAGSVVMPGAVVNVDAEIGAACIINTGATVDHECVLAHAVHVGPGAHLSGNVRVGAGSWVGVGATVRQGIHIGNDVMVGAGAVVVKSIQDGITVAGNPARTVKT